MAHKATHSHSLGRNLPRTPLALGNLRLSEVFPSRLFLRHVFTTRMNKMNGRAPVRIWHVCFAIFVAK